MKWLPALLFAAGVALAESQPQKFPIATFEGGLNSNYSGLGIADNEVQDSLNVYFDGTFPVEKREGYALCGSTDAVSMDSSWSYSDAGNNGWIIIRKPTKIIASNQGCMFTVTIATVSASDTINAVNAFGNIYFVDRTQGVYSWNGTSATFVGPTSPRGSLISEFRGRLWVSGLAHPNGNQLYSSGYLDGANWTLGSLTTSPVLLTFGLNDSYDNITSIFSGYNDSMQIFKNLSIYALYGFDQLDFEARILNREVGCIDNRSVQPFLGGLVFASRRGIEFFDGVTVQTPPISDKVGNLLNNNGVTSSSELSWTQTSQADFNNGVNVFTSTGTSPGAVVLGGLRDTFSDLSNWTHTAGTFTVSGNKIYGVTNSGYNTIYSIDGSSVSNNFKMSIQFKFPSGPSLESCQIMISTGPGGQGYGLAIRGSSHPRIQVSIAGPDISNENATVTFPSDTSLHTLSLERSSTGYMTIYYDGVSTGTFTDNTVSGFRNAYISCLLGAFANPPELSNFGVSSSTGSYYSDVHNSPNLTTFGSLSVTKADGGGTQTFYMRSSTGAFTAGSSTPAWTAQSDNTTISISTGTYFQVRDDFAITSATQTPTLNDFSVSWREGTPRQPMASVVADKRYVLSFSTTTSVNKNTGTLVLTKGPVWSFWDIPAGSLLSHRGAYYFTNNSDNGKVYTLFSGTSDDTAAINSYIKTKDFALGDITQDKLMDSFYLIFDSLGTTSITTKYFLDRQSTEYSLASVAQNEATGLNTAKLNFPLATSTPNYGKTISFKIGSNDTEDSLALYGGILNYRTRMTQ